MIFTKNDVERIALIYHLGKVKKIDPIKGGMINTNFLLETDKGKFILRFLRKTANARYIKERTLEFEVIKFLEKNNYPYQVPVPIKNKKGKIISNFKKRKYWVYNYIEGNKNKRLNNTQIYTYQHWLDTKIEKCNIIY